MLFIASIALTLATLATAKPPSDSRTYAVNYFYGNGPLTEGRLDPIVSPGENPSNHVHTFMGGSGLQATMGMDTALSAGCTNSKPKADNSNYWWPKLYFHDPNNGSFIDVDMYYAKVYYFSEPSDDETKAPPPGLRLLTGNAMRRSLNDQGGSLNIDAGKGTIQPVQFFCGTTSAPMYSGKGSASTGVGVPDPQSSSHGVGFPDANCDGYTTPLRYDLHFPSCYDPNGDLTDAFTNSAYPSSTGAKQGQNCPTGWIHIPHIFIEVYWNTPPFAHLWTPGQGTQPFVLAQGDPTGQGLHGDFLSGWNQGELQALIDGCDAGDAGFDQCPSINSEGGVNPSSGDCHIPAPSTEVIKGVLPTLPGCNPLQWGPGDATIQTTSCVVSLTNSNTTSPVASSSSSAVPVAASSSKASSSAAASSFTTSAVAAPVGPPSSSTAEVAASFSSSTISSAAGSSSSSISATVAPASSSASKTTSRAAASSSASFSTMVYPTSSSAPSLVSPVSPSSLSSSSTKTPTSEAVSSQCVREKVIKTVTSKSYVTVTAEPELKAEEKVRRGHVHGHAKRDF